MKERRIKVEGWLVLQEKDGAFHYSLDELKRDGKDEFWGLNELDDLKLTEEKRG